MKKLFAAIILPVVLLSLSHLAASQTGSGSLDQQLLQAAYSGDVTQVQRLLDKGANIEAKSNGGETALIEAAQEGHIDAVKLLLDKGANIEAKNSIGWTALMDAAWEGHADVVRLLLDKGANIEAKNYYGNTALIFAVRNGDAEMVMLLLDKGAQPSPAALAVAFKAGNQEVVKLLTGKVADMHMTASELQQQLIVAANGCGSVDQVRPWMAALAAMGANLNAKDQGGQTALMKALWYPNCNDYVARFLLDNGADVNAFDRGGTTVLMMAAKRGDADLVRALIEKGANMNAQDNDGQTALMVACDIPPHKDVVRVLIEKGANLNLQQIHFPHTTALDSAIFLRNAPGDFGLGPGQVRDLGEIVNMLQRAGARCNTQSSCR